jgi:hypothetical protein
MFQIVRLALDNDGNVIARRGLQPLFERREHAMLMARYAAADLWGDFGYDEERRCWRASDSRGREYRFVVEEVAAADMAA